MIRYDPSTGKYRAPTAGNYRVEVAVMKPTGQFRIIPNPDYRWWTPWRPKLIRQEVYRTERYANLVRAEAGYVLQPEIKETGDEHE